MVFLVKSAAAAFACALAFAASRTEANPAPTGDDAPVTAFAARAIAAESVHPNVRGALLAMEGQRSTVSLQPVQWRVWFYDPSALQAGKRVTVTGRTVTGVHEGVTEGKRVRLASYKPIEVIPPDTLKIDSDAAFAAMRASPRMKSVAVHQVAYELRRDKDTGIPMWRVDCFDERGRSATADIRADTGAILKLGVAREASFSLQDLNN